MRKAMCPARQPAAAQDHRPRMRQQYEAGTLFVTYCAGRTQRRARCARARLGYPVKIMAGGITGWMDEGFPLERDAPV